MSLLYIHSLREKVEHNFYSKRVYIMFIVICLFLLWPVHIWNLDPDILGAHYVSAYIFLMRMKKFKGV